METSAISRRGEAALLLQEGFLFRQGLQSDRSRQLKNAVNGGADLILTSSDSSWWQMSERFGSTVLASALFLSSSSFFQGGIAPEDSSSLATSSVAFDAAGIVNCSDQSKTT